MNKAVRSAIGLAVTVPAFFAFAGVAGTASAAEYKGTTVETYDYQLYVTAADYRKNDITVKQVRKGYDDYFRVTDKGDKLVNKSDECYWEDKNYKALLCPVYKPTIKAGDKDDQVVYDNSADKSYYPTPVWIYGGDGNDKLEVTEYSAGQGWIFGADGDDKYYSAYDNDIIRGGKGDDYLYGEEGNDKIWGRGGDDLIDGGKGHDGLWGETPPQPYDDKKPWGDDYLFGGYGNDTAFGGKGNDTLVDKYGYDKLYGEAGNDKLDVYDYYGGDSADGGKGYDGCGTDKGDYRFNCEYVWKYIEV